MTARIVAALDAQLKKGDKALIGNSAYRRNLSKVGARGAPSTAAARTSQIPPKPPRPPRRSATPT
jgi:hypothetical protein